MDDPYSLLGVKKDATTDEIRAAFRKLAKLHHPDLNPGKKDAEDKFKAISAANNLLSDPEQRARFDRGEIDASGAEKPTERRFYRDFGDQAGGGKYQNTGDFPGGFDPDDLSSIFGQAFGRGQGRGFAARGADAQYTLSVSFLDAANGALRRLSLQDGRTLDVNCLLRFRRPCWARR
jgi:DnaJ-class molecular chaperone